MRFFSGLMKSTRGLTESSAQFHPESNSAQHQALSTEERESLRQEIDQACLPVAPNWPMKTFAYRNPLRGWEHLPFDEAIGQAQQMLGGRGYIANEEYRQLYREGCITDDAVKRALQPVGAGISTQTVTVGNRSIASSDVLRLHLLFGFDAIDPALLSWELGSGDLTRKFRRDLPEESRNGHHDGNASYLAKLWESTLSVLNLSDLRHDSEVESEQEFTSPAVDLPSGRTVSDWLGSLAGALLVDQINDQMIKWTAAYLDEGMAGWEMPGRDKGFYRAWRELAARDYSGRFLGIRRFSRKVRDLPALPEDAIALNLQRLGIPRDRWTDYLSRQLAQLPGWAGFIRWLGENPDYPAQEKHPIDPVRSLFKPVLDIKQISEDSYLITARQSAVFSNWIPLKKKIESVCEDERITSLTLDFSDTRVVDHTVMEKLHQLQKEFEQHGRALIIEVLVDHQSLSKHPQAALLRGYRAADRG